jgi:hypothetical protein
MNPSKIELERRAAAEKIRRAEIDTEPCPGTALARVMLLERALDSVLPNLLSRLDRLEHQKPEPPTPTPVPAPAAEGGSNAS